MKPLTAKQQAVLDFIIRHIEKHWRPPTLRDIAKEFRFNSYTNGPKQYLKALERKGRIALTADSSRGIKPLGYRMRLERVTNGV